MIELPFRIYSVANLREHWSKRAARAKRQREGTLFLLKQAPMVPPKPPLTVTLIRIGPRKLDSDNLAGGFKAIRDGIADWLGVDDGDERLTWKYDQRTAKVFTALVTFNEPETA